MKRIIVSFLIVIAVLLSTDGGSVFGAQLFRVMPLHFIPNRGQADAEGLYYAKTSRYTLWLTRQRVLLECAGGKYTRNDVTEIAFLNANSCREVVPLDVQPHRVNYYIGKDPEKWKLDIPTSKAVLYKNIYNNIDLKIYGTENIIEYDWIIHPGGSPSAIRLEIRRVGPEKAKIDSDGNLVIKTSFGAVMHKKPVSYQLIDGHKIPVKSRFRRLRENVFGFRVGQYDEAQTLIIDPIEGVEYSTYLGGSGTDEGYGIAIDNSGYIYVAGYTDSLDFPVQSACQSSSGGNEDIFLTKLSPDGSAPVFSTYLGGGAYDRAMDMKIFENSDIYIAGYTDSPDFPSANSVTGGSDAFVARFDLDGNLQRAYCIGGKSSETCYALAGSGTYGVYITGYTTGKDFPTVNPHDNQTQLNHRLVFVTRIDSNLSTLEYSTLLGGFCNDYGTDIAVDKEGNWYVTGYTGGDKSDFPLKNAYQTEANAGKTNAFLCKFSRSNSRLIYSTFLGGTDDDYGYAVEVDAYGRAYVMGTTYSEDFPTKRSFQQTLAGGSDIFLTLFNSAGTGLVFSTYLGGSGDELAWSRGLAVNKGGKIYMSGSTNSLDFPVFFPNQESNAGGVDNFITVFNPDISIMISSTYLGSPGDDFNRSMVISAPGATAISRTMFLTGRTNSDDFILKNPFQNTYGGGDSDTYVTKFHLMDSHCIISIDGECSVGIPIEVSPSDYDGKSDGITYFERMYPMEIDVTLTAPRKWEGRLFDRWRLSDPYPIECYDPIFTFKVEEFTMITAYYQPPVDMSLSRTSFYFGADTSGRNSGDQTFFIRKSGQGTLRWSVTDDSTWLNCSPASGIDDGQVTVSVNSAGLAPGTYYGRIILDGITVSTTPQEVPVTLAVYQAGTTGVPFGSFDTPLQNATVSGSVPVTGWALDDVGVKDIKIYREAGATLAYIGKAVFVEGARPDVEQTYSLLPNNSRAGWGYMMLTNFLPNGGNGSFVLHAIAEDEDGHSVSLGTRTIICDNAHAVKPFGAIDTPEQGGVVSGKEYINFGWVLTPQPNYIPYDGSTLQVWVDGVPIGQPVYDNYRKDIAEFFPGYANSYGAVGYLYLDTTRYDTGVHTIQWTAIDSAANVDGIGSRFFTIVNAESNSQKMAVQNTTNAATRLFQKQSDTPVKKNSPLRIIVGYEPGNKGKQVFPDKNGDVKVHIAEVQRLEVQLGGGERPGRFYSGFMMVGDKIKPLPIGSYLDSEKGIFYWQPGPGFVGTYRLTFVDGKAGDRSSNINLAVTIAPGTGTK
jgi:hypothetical protein